MTILKVYLVACLLACFATVFVGRRIARLRGRR